jgi:alpha-ribazole phosphatase
MSGSIELLRHGDTGQSSYRGQLDDALSTLGWAQLRAATADRQWDAIVTSSLCRCADFARELATQQGVPLRVDSRLAEYHFGQWQGVSIERLAQEQGDALGKFWADPVNFPPPGAETFAAFRDRLLAALNDIAVEASSRRVLVVTHGGAVRLLRCESDGRDFGNMASIEVPHASLHPLPWRVSA